MAGLRARRPGARRTAIGFGVATLAAIAAVSVSGGVVASAQAPADAALVTRARGIHDRVITLDTHNDIEPDTFTAACNYTQRLTTQVNLPKMKDGGLDVSFMIAYVGQGPLTPQGYDGAYKLAIAKMDAIHRLTEQIAPKEIGLALTANDVRTIAASGRKVAVIGIENGYQVGLDLKHVEEFYNRGGRYMSPAHNGNSQLSDSNTADLSQSWAYGGLSPLGKQVIVEMNRLGMMVDVSHPSKAAMLQMAALSKAPIIASHSGVKALANHPRNMDDEQLLALKTSGGVIQIVALDSYVKMDPAERTKAIADLRRELDVRQVRPPAASGPPPCPVEKPGAAATPTDEPAIAALPEAKRAEYKKRLAAIDAKFPPAKPNVKDLVNEIDYVVKKIGIDHVGLSSDFDGGGGIEGWNSAADTFNVTLELVRRGYTEEQIAKIWSGNLLRVWGEVEKVAKEIQAGRR